MFKSRFGKKKELTIKNPNWHFLSIHQNNRNLIIKGLAHDLVAEMYPKETEIFDLVSDELLSSTTENQIIKSYDAITAGLPLGNLSELGSVKVLSYVGVIYMLLAERLDENLSLPTAATIIRDDSKLASTIIEKLNTELGIEQSTAMDIWEKSLDLIAPKYEFTYHQVVNFEENNTCEFKDVKLQQIINLIDEYAVAYSNAEGGRIFFGIRDDGKVEGIELPNPTMKDEIRQKIINKLFHVKPPLSTRAIEIKFHKVSRDGKDNPGRYVLEVVIPKPIQPTIYRTQNGTVYIKTASGSKKCTSEEVEVLRISLGLPDTHGGEVQ
jgi:hypothetical protein